MQLRTIYFLQLGNNGPVKIGITKYLEPRIQSMQSCIPIPLQLVLTLRGNRLLEKKLHDRFAKHKIQGEWYELGNELRDFINEQIQANNEGFESVDTNTEFLTKEQLANFFDCLN